MTLKCLLLTDKPENTRLLADFIEKTGTLTLEATASTINEASVLIDKTMPDIIFLSVQQFSQIKSKLVEKEKTPVFICTSLEKERNTINPAYTLLSRNGTPLSYTVFLDAVNKALVQLLGTRQRNNYKDENYFFIKSEYRIVKVNFEDILFCEGLKDYTQIYTNKKTKPIITLQNLKTFSDRLPSKNFVRIHRSYIISLNHIESISKKEVEIAEKIIPIGNSYRNNLLDIVKINS
jgi:two-component system LytT family response regulator